MFCTTWQALCVCIWGDMLSSLHGQVPAGHFILTGFLHCIAHTPPFFPHDLVFNMDAEKLHHTSLFTLQKNRSNNVLWHILALDAHSRLTTFLCWILNIYLMRFSGETSETIRKPTRNGVWQGPRKLNNSNTCSNVHDERVSWPIGVGVASLKPIDVCEWQTGRDTRFRLRCHTCSWCVDIAERFLHWCMVVEQEELLEIFRRLVYKLVFTQCALFPQPSLWEGSDRLRQRPKRRLESTAIAQK